ncbi:hypothetical protein [Paenibacillus tundrae]|uniref:Outer membrane lipoprotein-sorting protein n=1 Tax=Paenibacillus tundrae TaxID=528187 RepID=A0ABT9WAR5_9BACL|nr:hypothetical protein [Paenibacillus tundrae]MDQ0170343.1 outer membrane lipoprotein-sorting protein [Paenibacillus tundrae]
MKRIKMACVVFIILLLSVLSACGDDNILHGKSDHWDVALQRSTGIYSITYIGDETYIRDFVFDLTGTNINQQGSSLSEQKKPFKMSGTITITEDTKDPLEFKMSWNNQSESITFE